MFRETDSLPHQTESECTSSVVDGRDGRSVRSGRISSFTGMDPMEGSGGVVIERTPSDGSAVSEIQRKPHEKHREVGIELARIGDMSPDHSADSISNDPSHDDDGGDSGDSDHDRHHLNGSQSSDNSVSGSHRRFGMGTGRKHTLIPSTTEDFCEDDDDSDNDRDRGDRKEDVRELPLALEHSKSMTLVGMMVNSGFTDPGLANSLQELSRLNTA